MGELKLIPGRSLKTYSESYGPGIDVVAQASPNHRFLWDHSTSMVLNGLQPRGIAAKLIQRSYQVKETLARGLVSDNCRKMSTKTGQGQFYSQTLGRTGPGR